MKLVPTDPDVETIASRIRTGDIDLQPDFQRGEVWSEAKKQRLIDSILREWHVPPVHVVQIKDSSKQQVLDGQQRLTAIRDFVEDAFPIDGHTQPHDKQIASLDGLFYSKLPSEWRRKFNQFPIRVLKITDYLPGEPGELFFRLNQPTNLTAAEQRNAFFGPARQQVKELVEIFASYGLNKEFLGFSNSRMSYDDIVARVCATIEAGTLTEKITAATLTSRYRSAAPFSAKTINRCKESIVTLAEAKPFVEKLVKFNKATLYSWLVFFTEIRDIKISKAQIGKFISAFESSRQHPTSLPGVPLGAKSKITAPSFARLFLVYDDRSSARVADVSSVVLRDVILWIVFLCFLTTNEVRIPEGHPRVKIIFSHAPSVINTELSLKFLNSVAMPHVWGPLP